MKQKLYVIEAQDKQYLALCDAIVPMDAVRVRAVRLLGIDKGAEEQVTIQLVHPTDYDDYIHLFHVAGVVFGGG